MLFSVRLLLLVIAHHILLANGQQVGVSLQLLGQTIPNNSLVNLDDLAYQAPFIPGWSEDPTNTNGRQTLMCVTDLVACCETPMLGNWYLPANIEGGGMFRTNRGQNEAINGQQFYGSVRLWRRYTPKGRGLFRCEIPDANGINQNLYVNILFFSYHGMDGINPYVTISPSGSTTAGETYSLTCLASVHSNNPPSPNSYIMPPPTFKWFFGPNGNALLPSGSIPTATVFGNDSIYRSTLQFSSLSQSHIGNYTCRLGAGRLVNSVMVTVNAPAIFVQITASGAPTLGQNNYSITCRVSGVENLNPSVNYQWTKNNGIQTQLVGRNSSFLSFFRLHPSDAGEYSCNVTIHSAYLSSVVYASKRFEVIIIIPEPTVSLHSDSPNPILSGSSPTLTCTVELKSTVNVPVTVSMEWIGPDGTVILPATRPETISFTLYSSSNALDSVELADSGEYICTVKIEDEPEVSTSTNITIVDGLFQLKLKSVGICRQWYSESSEKSEQYSNHIKGALINAIECRCKCRFPFTNLLNKDLFICEDSSNLMIYRNALLGTHNFNGTQITGFIEDWVNTGPLIEINGNSLRVDSSCPTAISFLDEPVCGEKKEECAYDVNPKVAMCAQHLDNDNVANCFEGCVVRNG